MSLYVESRIVDGTGTAAKCIVATTDADWKLVQQILFRATNLWPDAPPQVKRISDIITNGKILQDYGPDQEI